MWHCAGRGDGQTGRFAGKAMKRIPQNQQLSLPVLEDEGKAENGSRDYTMGNMVEGRAARREKNCGKDRN